MSAREEKAIHVDITLKIAAGSVVKDHSGINTAHVENMLDA